MEHEYSVLGGLNRAAIGRYLSIAASLIASVIGAGTLALVNIAERLGITNNIPALILWPVTAGIIYTALYWWFESRVWKQPKLAALLQVPDLAGTWHCEGQTINADKSLGKKWGGEVRIVQSWDKLRIRLKTKQSGSNSIAAALLSDQADGYRLLYNYKNDPNIDEPELVSHRGSAELLFSHDLKTASGEYFNGHGRYTFGTMKLLREVNEKS
jgi:phosphate/sulfate permease